LGPAVHLLLVLAAQAPTPLSLEEAIALALANNSTFKIIEQDVNAADALVESAEGVFAPHLFAEVDALYAHNPGIQRLSEFTETHLFADIGVQGLLTSGLSYRLEIVNSPHTRNDQAIYDPFYSAAVRLTLAQPLLRGAWFSVNRADITIASIRKNASIALRKAQAERIIANVEVNYWLLVLAYKKLEVRKEAVKIAEQQVELSKKRLKLGASAPIDALEARSQLARTLEQIPLTEQEIIDAEAALLSLLQPPASKVNELVPRYFPTSTPDTQPFAGSLEEYLASAEANRPDLAAALADVEAALVAEEVAENSLWPRLDLVANAGLTGISGTFRGIARSPEYPDPALEGGSIEAYKNLRYPDASIGLLLDIPLDNSEANGQHRFQQAQTLKSRAFVESLKSQIRIEVITAFRQLKADQERLKASAETLQISESLLEGQKKLFNEGVATSFDVSRTSSAVTRARIAHVRAEVRTRISQARLAFAEGRYLETHRVQLIETAPR
jgi:outer membrane protein TolC